MSLHVEARSHPRRGCSIQDPMAKPPAQVVIFGASDDAPPLREYPAGSWGLAESDALFHGCEGGWSDG